MADLLRRPPPGPGAFRAQLERARTTTQPLVLPGVYDALGARLVERAGFDAVYMTGFGTTASLLGRPDVGLLGLTEMVDNARRIVAATDLPVLADADTGYGNQINVIRTVQEYERAGVAGIHLEDQIMPKKCGHLDNKQVVDVDTMVGKVRAAVAARVDPELVIVARTDARAVHGLDDAIERARRCADAGADVLFVEALEGIDELAQVGAELSDHLLLFNWAEGGRTPPLTYAEIAELGFALIIMPIGALLAATAAMQQYLGRLKSDGTPAAFVEELVSFGAFTDLIGLPEIDDLERRFA